MRVEGVTHASVGGRGAIVFVDDGGGYRSRGMDDPRLKKPRERKGVVPLSCGSCCRLKIL